MNWIIYAFIAAFSSGLGYTISKRVLKNQDPLTVLWWNSFFTLPYLILILIFTGIPGINSNFWQIILIIVPIAILIEFLFMKGVKLSPLSLIMPFSAFTPLVVLLSSYIILKERPEILGIFGIIFIVSGIYIINLQGSLKLLAPFKNIIKEKGALFIIVSAILWGLILPLGKIATSYSSPIFYSVFFMILFNILLFPIYLKFTKNKLVNFRNNYKSFLMVGGTTSSVMIFTWLAISQGFTSYANAIVNTRILVAVFLGGYFLKEGYLKQRLIAALIVFIGIVLIILSK